MERRNIKNIRIIRRLLERPDGSWTMYALAKDSGASQPFGVKMIRKLESMGFVSRTKVTDLAGLARYGASIIPGPLVTANFYIPEPVEFLKKSNERYAITTYFAENLVTHHLFPSRCDAYMTAEGLNRTRKRLWKKGLAGAGNLRLMIPVDERIIDEARVIHGTSVVSFGQLMIDLVKEGGVCIEAFDILVNRHVRKG